GSDGLQFVGDVARQRLDSQEPQNIVRIRGTVDDGFALVYHLPVMRGDVLVLGIRYSCAIPSRSVITSRCLPLVSLPNDTVPVTSANVPASFGARASNSSATRGRPPVMSRVLDVSCGIRASTSATATSWPSLTVLIDPSSNVMLTGNSDPASFTSSPRSFNSFTCGRTPFAAAPARRFGSMTTSVDRRVTSSTCLRPVTPAWTFST